MASLIRYDRWLCHASKRAEYWHSRLEDVRREQALAAQRAEHARHGADLQRAAWSQRALAQQERQRVTKLNQMRARGVKREAAARKADKRLRDACWMGHFEALHDEVSEIEISWALDCVPPQIDCVPPQIDCVPHQIDCVPHQVSEIAISTKQARDFLSHSRHVGASTLRAAAGAIDQRREALLRERHAEAREMRDRVRASSLIHVPVPAQLAHDILTSGSGGDEWGGAGEGGSGGAAAGGGGSASARVARTYRALENPHSVLATTRAPRPSSARCGERTERMDRSVTWAPSPARRGATAGAEEESSSEGYYDC